MDTSTYSVSAYQSKLEQLLPDIKTAFTKAYGEEGDSEYQDFMIKFGFKIVDENGTPIDKTDSLINNIKDVAKAKGEDISSILSDTSDERLSKKVDRFQSNLSTIQNALDSLKCGEEVNLTDLIQEFISTLFNEADVSAVDFRQIRSEIMNRLLSATLSDSNSITDLSTETIESLKNQFADAIKKQTDAITEQKNKIESLTDASRKEQFSDYQVHYSQN